jgi:chloramphenicol 3-O-phosphotransferase
MVLETNPTLIGVHCALDEIDRRERSRGDRTAGEGRSHIEDDRIHASVLFRKPAEAPPKPAG